MPYKTNTPNYDTDAQKISNYADFINNIDDEYAELKKMKRNNKKNSKTSKKVLGNRKMKFNKVTRKMDQLSPAEIEDKIDAIEVGGGVEEENGKNEKNNNSFRWEFKNEKIDNISYYKGHKIKIAKIPNKFSNMYYATSNINQPYLSSPSFFENKKEAYDEIIENVDHYINELNSMTLETTNNIRMVIDQMDHFISTYKQKHNNFEKRGVDECMDIAKNSKNIDDAINKIEEEIEKYKVTNSDATPKANMLPKENVSSIIRGMNDFKQYLKNII